MQEKDNYYENLKSESYKAMLDSEIQASIARDQAMKYTQNQMNASGFGGQGMSESSALGVQNNYRQALSNAANQYQTDLSNINQQQRQEEINQEATDYAREDDNFKSITTLMSGATNQDQLNKVYDTYKNDTALSENSRKQLELLYGMYSDNFANNDVGTAQISLDEKNATVVNKQGKIENVDLQSRFNNETRTLRNAINTGKLTNNSYVMLEQADGLKLYVKYINGALYYTTEDDYNKNKANAYTIKKDNNLTKLE